MEIPVFCASREPNFLIRCENWEVLRCLYRWQFFDTEKLKSTRTMGRDVTVITIHILFQCECPLLSCHLFFPFNYLRKHCELWKYMYCKWLTNIFYAKYVISDERVHIYEVLAIKSNVTVWWNHWCIIRVDCYWFTPIVNRLSMDSHHSFDDVHRWTL